MDLARAEAIFARTLDDRRLSRSEKKALKALFAAHVGDANARAAYRDRVVRAARGAVSTPADRNVVEWLGEMMKILEAPRDAAAPRTIAEAYFSPGDACRDRITALLAAARRTVDVCVFTITDNALARAIVDAARRGVTIRIITDDQKAGDRGSDVIDLSHAGARVIYDNDPSHMHHKFALFDREILLSGSYNWTRSAARENHENILVTDEARLVTAYQAQFERLWRSFAG